MTPAFPRVWNAIHITLDYYNIEWIKNHMFRLSNSEVISSIPHICDMRKELVSELHKLMEAEINQTIYGCVESIQTELFEQLKECLLDSRIIYVNEQLLRNKIDEYNDDQYIKFERLIEEQVKEFQNQPDFYRAHLEEYEDFKSGSTVGFTNYFFEPKINYKYYCIEQNPRLIDTQYLPHYCAIVGEAIGNLRRIISKFVERYNQGKIKPAATQFPLLPSSIEPPLEKDTDKLRDKLPVNLNVPQLAYLFKLLWEAEIFNTKTKQHLFRFIAASFETKGKGDEDISLNKLRGLFSKNGTDKSVALFWVKILSKMTAEARNV